MPRRNISSTSMSASDSSKSSKAQKLHQVFLHAAHADVASILHVCKILKSQLNNASRIISGFSEVQKQQQSDITTPDISEALHTVEDPQVIEVTTPKIDAHFTNNVSFTPFDDTPTKLSPSSEDKGTDSPKKDRSEIFRSSIEHQPEHNNTSSPAKYIFQKRYQSSPSQTPCPGDGTDDIPGLEHQSITFPSVRKFANKMARILPANRRERGGTLRYQTPEGGYKPLSPDPSTIETSPSPYHLAISPSTPGTYQFVRNSSQLELFNTIHEYVEEVEHERDEEKRKNAAIRKENEQIREISDEITNELAKTAQELMDEGEKLLKLERESFSKERESFRKSLSLYKSNEQTLKTKIKELEVENERLRAAIVTEKGSDHLGVQGANPQTGVWSDVEGGVKRKGRGRWRRTDTSWTFGASDDSTGTVVKKNIGGCGGSIDVTEGIAGKTRERRSSAGTIIRNYHVHHHHHWRVVGGVMKRSISG